MKKYAMGKKLDRYEKILYFISAVIVYGFCYIYHAVFQIKNIAVSGYILFAAFSADRASCDLADQQGGGCIPEEYLLCSGCEGNYLLRIPTERVLSLVGF